MTHHASSHQPDAQLNDQLQYVVAYMSREMTIGAMRRNRANLAISNTGVTDDTDPGIEPGTHCFAWLFASRDGLPERLFSETRQFSGERNAIREQAALYALTQIAGWHARFSQPADPARAKGSSL